MWLIRTALRRPYTFVVMAMLIALGGIFSTRKTPTDIFPSIDIPVISVIWNYGGLQPDEMEKRITNNFERFLTTVVSNIDHVESQTLTGIAIVKVYLQPGANVAAAIATTTSVAQSAVRSMPPGAVPPLILQYSATSVPIMQVALESDSLSEQQLFDYGVNFIRNDIATIPGAVVPYPYGGKQRQIMVDIDPARLHGLGLSPRDVNSALAVQNVILPSGTAKIGTQEYPIVVSASPETLAELAALPIKTVNGRTIYMRDVANVRDGSSPQTNLVHVEGRKSVLMSILKNGDASTLEVNARIRDVIPRALERLPKEAQGKIRVKLLFDQSVFVRASISGVVREALIAAGLTAIMILMFLGSWRSTLTVVISIPLSIAFSIIVMWALGQTLNVMTLGGLALAVGILVDDATVAIENIHRNMHQRKPFTRAIIDGAQQIAIPAFVSTLCICIVFAPIAFLTGAARSLFVPMAMAVVFAMAMSYLLSRTLVPTMVHFLLKHESGGPNRFTVAFERGFARLRDTYGRGLAWALQHRAFVVTTFALFVAGSMAMLTLVGRDFFPSVDAGLIKLHVRGVPGTRLEETEKRIAAIERSIRTVIPAGEIETMIDVLGTPYSGINLSLSEGAAISPADGQILIALKPEDHRPTPEYVRKLREVLRRQYPETTFFFLAPDISTQVLNFGLAAPIDLQVIGPIGSEDKTLAFATELSGRVAKVPGAVDVHLAQVSKVPAVQIQIDRVEAQQTGLAERDVASDLLVSLASSGTVAPSYWLDKRGVQYLVAVQTPQYAINSLDALRATPISTPGADNKIQTVGNVAQISRGLVPANITHYNVARTFDVQANVDGTDLGAVSDRIAAIVKDMTAHAPPGTRIVIKGQSESMDSSFSGLESGLLFAVLLVYLIMVVNFQSWLDPFIILMAIPGALAGIVWMLFLTGTTLSVPALIGSIMCVGVATANSILVVSFANEQRAQQLTREARAAALAAGMTRLRPVMMTALAMVLGMLPMALGLGEGGEQNAPLGRAVIGGLTLATLTTLVFVPVMYSLLRRTPPVHREVDV
ncbi:MAG TPA: efflux RND transporter permease subunit [Kofleriaceae bacterium]|nr:efflux RND transporter permease subunit [Kofleriaceae bacterium]